MTEGAIKYLIEHPEDVKKEYVVEICEELLRLRNVVSIGLKNYPDFTEKIDADLLEKRLKEGKP